MLDLQQAPRDLPLVLYRRVRTHQLFRRMMSRQGIDLSGSWWRGFEGTIFRGLRRCAECPEKTLCKSWLGRPTPRGYPSFCRNTGTIEACRILDPQAPPLGTADSSLGSDEPSLAEVVAEPIVRQLMGADGAAEQDWGAPAA